MASATAMLDAYLTQIDGSPAGHQLPRAGPGTAKQVRCTRDVKRDVTNRDNAGRLQASHLFGQMCARQLQAYSTVL